MFLKARIKSESILIFFSSKNTNFGTRMKSDRPSYQKLAYCATLAEGNRPSLLKPIIAIKIMFSKRIGPSLLKPIIAKNKLLAMMGLYLLRSMIYPPIFRLRLHFGGHRLRDVGFLTCLNKAIAGFICVSTCSAWKILHFGTSLSFRDQSHDELRAVKDFRLGIEIVPIKYVFGQNLFLRAR